MTKDKTIEQIVSKIKGCMGSDSKVKPGYPFKLKDVAAALEKEQEIVLKTVVSSGAGIQKDADGDYAVIGIEGLTLLVDALAGKKPTEAKPEKSVKAEKKEEPGMPEEKKEKKERKPAGKSILKQILSSEMDISAARKLLVGSKMKSPMEVAFMSDAEVLKIISKDYSFLTIGSMDGKASAQIAVPTDELKKLDLSHVIIL